MPADLSEFDHLEDLTWLLTPNYANRGASHLMFDEAGWLFRTIRDLEQPMVAEVARVKGGTTFLMAAAGAHVVSVDDDSFERGRDRRQGTGSGFHASVQTALDRAGLADRVELVPDDAVTYVVEPGRFDLVYLDIPLPEQRMQQLFDLWWPGVKPGGMLVVRDGTEPRVPREVALAAKLPTRPDAVVMDGAPGRFVVATKTG
jgi:SAM-dependent methyltransferase